MQIKRLEKINNAFSYAFFEWDKTNPSTYIDKKTRVSLPRDTNFKKRNVVFGENGNGKSKLVKIFKSIDGCDSAIERHHDRPADSQEVLLSLDGKTPKLLFNGAWDSEVLKGKFLFFDKYFIESSVHSVGADHSDNPQRKQQRGRDIVYLGNFSAYNEEINRLMALKASVVERDGAMLASAKARVLGLLGSAGISIDSLAANRAEVVSGDVSEIPLKKETLTTLSQELSRTTAALKEKAKILALKNLQEVNAPFSFEFTDSTGTKSEVDPDEILSFTVAKGVQDALHKIHHKKDFIQKGLHLMSSGEASCPFCEQDTRGDEASTLIQSYREIFDEAFAMEERSVRQALRFYRGLLERLRDLRSPHGNQAALDELKSFIPVPDTLAPLGASDAERTLLEGEIELVLKKEAVLLDKIETSGVEATKRLIAELGRQVTSYNEAVRNVNARISQLKTDAGDGKLELKKTQLETEAKSLGEAIFYLENKDALVTYLGEVDKSSRNAQTIQGLERIYQAMKEKMVEEFGSFVDEYFLLIKDFVKRISPSMDILTVSGQASYDRRNPRDPANCGFRIEYGGKDCAGSLSEGERQVIALAFFFARLLKESDKEKIVVLDDPITSFDAATRHKAAELIAEQTETYSQLFVFTCDPLFREFCLKQIADRNFYYVLKTAGSSCILFDPRKNGQSICDSYDEELRNMGSVSGTDENVVAYGQKLRFSLETRVREDYLGQSEEKLAVVLSRLAAGGGVRATKLVAEKDKILDIYTYCNTGGLAHFPKSGSTSWTELMTKANEYLSLGL